jgi:hypothetical protein
MSKHVKRGSAIAVGAAIAAGAYGATVASAHNGTSTPGGSIGGILTFIVDLVLEILGIPGKTIGSLLGG